MTFRNALSGFGALSVSLLFVATTVMSGCQKHGEYGEGLPYTYAAAQLMTHNQMAYAKPNGNLKQMDALTGYWTWEQLVWPFPGSDPVSLKGVCSSEWILGKRYVKLDFKYVNENADIERGYIFIGHDRMLNNYSMYEIFSTMTAPISGTGTWDEEKQLFTWGVEVANPLDYKMVKLIRTTHLDKSGSLTFKSWRKDIDGTNVPYQQTVLSSVSKADMEKAFKASTPGAVEPVPTVPPTPPTTTTTTKDGPG